MAAEIAKPGLPDSPLISRASGTAVPEEVVSKSIKGNPSDLEDVAGWLLQNNATTEEAGVRAIAVALAASRSPQINSAQAHHQMLERVRQAWSMAVCVPRLFQADTANDFRPAPGTIAVDFGGAQSARMPGFVRVTDQTPNVAGHNLRPYDNPGGGALFGDGLDGVEEFAVALENGTYRVTILSMSHNSGRYAAAPLGYRINVNGQTWLIGEAPSPTWLRHGELGGTGLTPLLVSTGSEPLRGGGITLKATVSDGTLRIAFSQRVGMGASLAGLLIERVVSASQVHLFGEALGTNYAIDRCLDFQQQVDSVFQEISDRRNRGIGPGGGPGNSSSGASSSGGDEPPPPSPS